MSTWCDRPSESNTVVLLAKFEVAGASAGSNGSTGATASACRLAFRVTFSVGRGEVPALPICRSPTVVAFSAPVASAV